MGLLQAGTQHGGLPCHKAHCRLATTYFLLSVLLCTTPHFASDTHFLSAPTLILLSLCCALLLCTSALTPYTKPTT